MVLKLTRRRSVRALQLSVRHAVFVKELVILDTAGLPTTVVSFFSRFIKQDLLERVGM